MGALVMDRRTHPRGFFLADAITGLGIILVLSAVTLIALSHYRKGTDRLTDTRQANRLAEQTLLALQLGQAAPTPGEEEKIDIAPLPGSTDRLPNCAWVRVRAVHNGRSAELVGIVPAEKIKGGHP